MGSSVSNGLCGKVSEVKRFLQFETILRTFNTKFLSASGGYAHCWDRLAPQNPVYRTASPILNFWLRQCLTGVSTHN